MITWQTYGKAGTLVASGILIAGTLWFNRPGAAVRGEDMAECLSALSERMTLAYMTGTNAPVWTTNSVTAHILWDQFYGSLLSAARAAATNAAGSVLWLDASQSIADGDTLVEAAGKWTLTESTNGPSGSIGVPVVTRDWSLAAATSHADRVSCSGSLRPISGYAVWPGVAPTSAPLSRAVYGVTNGLAAHAAPVPWWSHVGNGSNSYAYVCEFLPRAVVTAEGSGFSNSPPSFTANLAGDSAEITVRSLDTGPLYCSALYTVSRSGLSNSYFVVTDNGDNVTNKLIFAYPQYTIDEGVVSRTIAMTARAAPPVPTTVTVERVYGTGIEVSFFDSPITGGNTIKSNDLTKYVLLSAPVDSDAVNAAVVYKVSYDGQDNYLSVVERDAQYAPDIALSPVSASGLAKGSGTAVIRAALTRDADNAPRLNRQILSNGLTQARNVLAGMTRSIWIGGPADVTISNCLTYHGSYFAFTNYPSSGSRPADTVGDLWAAGAGDIASGAAETGVTTNTALYADLVDVALSATFDTSCLDYGGPGELWSFTGAAASGSYESTVAEGCTLPYPSREAILSNYVARIAVYACAAARYVQGPYVLANMLWNATNSEYSLSGTIRQPADWAAEDYGTGLWLAAIPQIPGTLTVSAAAYDDPGGSIGIDAAARTRRLTLLGEWTNPADVPAFSIGVRVPEVTASLYHAVASENVYPIGDEFGVDAWSTRRGGSVVSIDALVVVVDWDWQHLNPDSPFVP